MKKLLAIAILAAAAGFLPAKSAPALAPEAHPVTVNYSLPPVAVKTVCTVDGMSLPVDYSNNVWVSVNDNWYVVGTLYFTSYGPIAYAMGHYYTATC